MNMNTAIEAFTAATTEEEVRAAYAAMLEWSDALEGSEADDVDNVLNQRGLPSLSQRLTAVQMGVVIESPAGAKHHVALFGGEIIGEAATEEEAIALTGAAEAHCDFYDAEDGPNVQGYEADGKGVWIVDPAVAE